MSNSLHHRPGGNIVVHHHPPYSSDENDYGDTWTGTSTRGHLRLRDLAGLYERHGVPLVISGHIHTYERTWPIYEGRVDTDGGVTYVITGGRRWSVGEPFPHAQLVFPKSLPWSSLHYGSRIRKFAGMDHV